MSVVVVVVVVDDDDDAYRYFISAQAQCGCISSVLTSWTLTARCVIFVINNCYTQKRFYGGLWATTPSRSLPPPLTPVFSVSAHYLTQVCQCEQW